VPPRALSIASYVRAPKLSAAFGTSAALDEPGAPRIARRGQMTFLDREGLKLADLDEAANEAIRRAWEIKTCERMTDLPVSNGTIVVDNEFPHRPRVAVPRRTLIAGLRPLPLS
jgi:hypothetical protein